MRYQQKISPIKRSFLQKKSDIISFLYYLNILRHYGIRKIYQLIKLNKQRNFKYKLGTVAIIKNEAPYLKEWIEFHKIVGVEIFYLYDNESTDNTKEILQPYIKQGVVKYEVVKGTGQQISVYNRAIQRYRNEVQWMAILDADEFIVPIEYETVVQMIESINQQFSQILIGWLIYGSNGFQKKPEGLVIENFNKHADLSFMAYYKPIINPRLVLNVTFPHWANVIGKTVDENGKHLWGYPFITKKYAMPSSKSKVRINHYYSKSLEEFLIKSNRGYADYNGSDRSVRDMDAFREHDQNIEVDNIMNRFYYPLHEILNKKGDRL
ncbi:glycosyltransferase [Leuconostoc citreum]|uniref:glycosyltransferase family 92 protein n=1 Tax=Leuconostoc citreum TaxID=33964 RepID=UPI0021824DC6|nr:glycosyltransferase family 92 protein [Leuconostoc citreum]MCS8594986.1 glycosyltransferase [Leuconostoc citreum]